MTKVNHKRTKTRSAEKKSTASTITAKQATRAKRPLASKKPTAAAPKSSESVLDVVIDYPQEGELVVPGHYAIRISAKPEFDIEISTDGKVWFATRPSVGFHWFDWTPEKPGRVVLSLRAKSGKGRWKDVTERECIILDNPGY